MIASKPLKLCLKIQQLVSNLRRLRGANLYLRVALRALNGFYFSLKIDWYREALTVQHYMNNQKVGKRSNFSKKKSVRKLCWCKQEKSETSIPAAEEELEDCSLLHLW